MKLSTSSASLTYSPTGARKEGREGGRGIERERERERERDGGREGGREGERERAREGDSTLVSLLIRTLILLDQGSTLMISLTLEAPSANTATLGVRASTYELGGEGDTNIQYIKSKSILN